MIQISFYSFLLFKEYSKIMLLNTLVKNKWIKKLIICYKILMDTWVNNILLNIMPNWLCLDMESLLFLHDPYTSLTRKIEV